MSQTSSIHGLGRGVQFSIRLLEEIFTIIVTSFTEPYNLQRLGFPLSADGSVFLGVFRILPPDIAAEHHIVLGTDYFGDNTSRTPVG